MQEHHHAAQLKKLDIETVIVCLGNELSLWKALDGSYQKVKSALVPSEDLKYARLKQVAHIPLLVSMILNQLIADSTRKDLCLSKLRLISEELNGLKNGLDKIFESDDLTRQQHIIESTLKTIELLMNDYDETEVPALKLYYLARVHDALIENNRLAAESHLQELDKITTDWGLKSKATLEKSRFLIVGPHGPRKGRIDIQYYVALFETILGISKVKDNRLYHVEMLPSQMAGIDILNDLILNFLLGSELNKSIGEDILDDNTAMFSDILKTHAPPIVGRLLRV